MTEYTDSQVSTVLTALGAFIVGGNAIAIGAIYGAGVRLAALLLGSLALLLLLYATRLTVVVDATGLRVGRARIGWGDVARVELLEGEDFRRVLGIDAHPADYVRIRGNRRGLRVWLDDASDPHRAWVFSIRDAQRLRGVLEGLGRVAA